MSAKTTKGYLLAIFCGLAVLAVVVLVMLQWNVRADFLLYGKPVNIPTVWVILIAGVVSPIFVLLCRGLGKGVWILYTIRRAEAKAAKTIKSVVDKAAATSTPAVQQETDKQPE